MSENNRIILNNKEYPLETIQGTDGNKGVDINKLRAETGYITYDMGFANTGPCKSGITYIDGEKGVLRHRGYPIQELAENATFLEVAYLLMYGDLPTLEQCQGFKKRVTVHSLIHEGMKNLFPHFPYNAHPMAVLSSMVSTLSAFYSEHLGVDPALNEENYARLIAKITTIAAYIYKRYNGMPTLYPTDNMHYCENFLHMTFGLPTVPYEADPDYVKALEKLFILHADHEQACSTSAVRLVGSSHSNVFTAIASGIGALWGPLHGGANQAVMNMLDEIYESGQSVKDVVIAAKDKNNPFRLMGFGHRVYKNFDPRALILKKTCDEFFDKKHITDPRLEIAKELEEVALHDEYFVERKLYPNVDFYSGFLYRAMGFPTKMFPVLFAIGRLPGWLAHYKEMIEQKEGKRIGRPRQIYTGSGERHYIPLEQR
jgi:citrate synthase